MVNFPQINCLHPAVADSLNVIGAQSTSIFNVMHAEPTANGWLNHNGPVIQSHLHVQFLSLQGH